jgi:hypothetical protein
LTSAFPPSASFVENCPTHEVRRRFVGGRELADGELMSTTNDLGQRVAALEAAVAELQRRPAAPAPAGDWLKQITGSVKDAEAFEKILRLGREFRDADRPLGDEEAAS